MPEIMLKGTGVLTVIGKLEPAGMAQHVRLDWEGHLGGLAEALPGFSGTTNLSATPRRPACPSRASGWSSLTTLWGFPCCVRFPCVHAVATTPAQRLGVLLRSLHPAVSAFPERVVGSACASSFSRLARRSLALRPAHSGRHPFVTRYPKASATSLPP